MFRDPLVNFYVKDVEVSVRFYRELFAFQEMSHSEGGRADARRTSIGHLTLGRASIESARQLHDLPLAGGPPRAEVVAWTDDIDEAFARLTAKGAVAISKPHDFLANLRSAWVADPDGNPVQIVMQR